MSCFVKQKKFLESWKTQQASNPDQGHRLQLMEPHFKAMGDSLIIRVQKCFEIPGSNNKIAAEEIAKWSRNLESLF